MAYTENDYDFLGKAIVIGSFRFKSRDSELAFSTFDVSIGGETREFRISDELWRELPFGGGSING